MIAQWLRAARIAAGLDERVAAVKAHMRAACDVVRLEQGGRKPSLAVLFRLCAAYDAPYAEGLAILLGERVHGFSAQRVITCRKLLDDPSACARCMAELPKGCPATCDSIKGYTTCPEELWRECPCCALRA